MESVDLRLAVRHEADMGRATVCLAGPEPEEHATVAAKAFQVGMARRSVLAVVVEDMADPKRSQGLLIESDRATNVADRNEHMVEHRCLLAAMGSAHVMTARSFR